MDAVKTINLPDWLNIPQLSSVMDALGGDALLVGGCVRNALMGKHATDIDIATKHTPDTVIQKMEAAGIKTVPTGIDHGTVTAIVDGKPFEITTLRKDVETDGRRAVVAFSDSWEEDAQRRDFTMNTLLMDRGGNVFDPTGQGLADLEARRVIFVGDPDQRIAEDHLRILRFFRFHAWYGEGEMDSAALKACGKAVDKIGDLSKERITQEVFKLLASTNVYILKTINEIKALPQLFHMKHDLEILNRYYAFGAMDDMAALLILSAFEETHLQTLETRMVFSGAQRKTFTRLLDGVQTLDTLNEKDIKKLIYHIGNADALQCALLFAAQAGTDVPDDIMHILKNWQAPVCPHTGDQLIKAGYKPGPELGQKLKQLEDEWLANVLDGSDSEQ